MPKSIAAVAMLALLGAAPVADTPVKTGLGTRYFSGAPPVRFVKEVAVPVVFIAPARMEEACGLDSAPTGLRLIACVRRTATGQPVMFLPHPCLSSYEPYALIVCHETAHVNGWAGDHPA